MMQCSCLQSSHAATSLGTDLHAATGVLQTITSAQLSPLCVEPKDSV